MQQFCLKFSEQMALYFPGIKNKYFELLNTIIFLYKCQVLVSKFSLFLNLWDLEYTEPTFSQSYASSLLCTMTFPSTSGTINQLWRWQVRVQGSLSSFSLMEETKFCVPNLSITLRISALNKAELCPFPNRNNWNLFALEHWGSPVSPSPPSPYIPPSLFFTCKDKKEKLITILVYILSYGCYNSHGNLIGWYKRKKK